MKRIQEEEAEGISSMVGVRGRAGLRGWGWAGRESGWAVIWVRLGIEGGAMTLVGDEGRVETRGPLLGQRWGQELRVELRPWEHGLDLNKEQGSGSQSGVGGLGSGQHSRWPMARSETETEVGVVLGWVCVGWEVWAHLGTPGQDSQGRLLSHEVVWTWLSHSLLLLWGWVPVGLGWIGSSLGLTEWGSGLEERGLTSVPSPPAA